MTWLDLYKFLNDRANNVNAIGTFDWSKSVKVFDNATGEIFDCDTYYLNNNDEGLVFMFNHSKEKN